MKSKHGHLFKRGQVYWVQWQYDGRRHRQTTGATNRKDAEERAREIVAPFALRTEADQIAALKTKLDSTAATIARIEDERNPPPSLQNLWQAYLDAPNRPDTGSATLHQYECQVGRFVAWLGEEYPEAKTIRDISPAIAERFMSSLRSGHTSSNTFNKYLGLFRLIWRVLRDRAKLDVDPWEGIARRQLVTVSKRELTVEELRTVCRAAKGEMQTLFAIGLFSGLRLGDAATLKWSEVDLDRGVILRVTNKTARRNPRPVTVPLVPELKGMLMEKSVGRSGVYVMPEIARQAIDDYRGLIRTIQSLFAACGIKTKGARGTDRKRAPVEVGFHSLRHSFVSICRMAGVPLAVVESVVGHSNPAMTRHYTHVGIEAATKAVAAIPAVMTDPPKPEGPGSEPVSFAEIRLMIASQTAENWQVVQARVLAMIPA